MQPDHYLGGIVQEVGVSQAGENFVLIARENLPDIRITGLTPDEARVFAIHFGDSVSMNLPRSNSDE